MDWINIVVPITTTVIGALLGHYFSRPGHKQKVAESEAKAKIAEEKLKHQNRLAFYRMMSAHLHASHDAFIDQCRIRNRLLRMLGHEPKTFDWENEHRHSARRIPSWCPSRNTNLALAKFPDQK